MSADPITAALNIGNSLIERIWPDPGVRAKERRKLAELAQQGDLAQLNSQVELMAGQLKVNAAEAQHKSVFVAGWRPFIGWCGGAAMAYQFVLYPLLIWVWAIAGAEGDPPPVMDTGALFSLITGMLGIGAMRSHDKRAGVQTDSIGGK